MARCAAREGVRNDDDVVWLCKGVRFGYRVQQRNFLSMSDDGLMGLLMEEPWSMPDLSDDHGQGRKSRSVIMYQV